MPTIVQLQPTIPKTIDDIGDGYSRTVKTPVPGTGPPGPSGPAGATGPTGPAGEGGGTTILSGTAPPTPVDGVEGEYYIDTDSNIMYGPKTGTVWPVAIDGGAGASGGGTVILNGVGPPADTVGEAGDYYVDEVGDVMYGPKATEGWGVPQYGLPTETPTDTTPAGGYELGNRYDFHQPVQIIGLRFWRGASSSVLTRKLRLWSSTGVLVAETVNTVESAGVGGYVEAMFPTPVIAVDEARYTCSYTEPGGQFQWNVVTPSNPNAAVVTFVDGVYGTTLGAFPPNSQGASINRFCDPIYREPSADVWPVAVGAGGGSGAAEVWEGPAEPSPLADYRIWIDSDEPAPPPPTGDLNFVYTQLSPATSWPVAHNLGKFPAVEVVDSGGSVVIPDVLYVDNNNVTLSFGSITSGKAYFN